MATNRLTAAELLPHQQCVKDELSELLERIEKLQGFMDSDSFKFIDAFERDLLRSQYEAMGDYASALIERLRFWRVVV